MYIEEVKSWEDQDHDQLNGDLSCTKDVVVSDAKRILVGAGARVLFYPTLLYNVVRNKIQSEFRWWDRVDQFIILGAVPFPADVLRLKELGVSGVVTLNESYETLVPTSLYHDHNIDHLVIPTRDYLFAPSFADICQAVDFIHAVDFYFEGCKANCLRTKPQLESYSNFAILHYVTNVYLFMLVSFEENASLGKTTYVHCKAGRGRSTTIVLCYLVEHRQMAPEAAYEYVRSIRPRVLLASSQWQAVQDYYLQKVKKIGNSDCITLRTSLPFPVDQDSESFDDGSVVVVTETDLDGYDASYDSGVAGNHRLAELSLACKVQFASQSAIARLSCLWPRWQEDHKTSRQKLRNSVGNDQLGSLSVDIWVY
ncbi:phosphatidylglycerophosphate phosphatase PTPMT1 [Citrus sinensis]|uniref:Phosphatidylglycerophosphate phosphatase PTPMT1 n=1 Tax=Citrus sinensis TaxID=2711 RepID=A0ACB8MTW1_CITSI|nr:phosphatidylglycerophosphate phosphatase PTPMT1 [Citrus sinensis]KAH9788590.1 phosphatidylglycerophosphate phosphatase PTPMT1 [Citrus sinensis]